MSFTARPAVHIHAPRALIADDERLLREQLQARLAECWPELQICGSARDGLEALKLADELRPDVVFLDIRMPGLTGIEAAREIAALEGWRGEIVFATAYDEYAVTAFEEGALDYRRLPARLPRHLRAADHVQDGRGHQGAGQPRPPAHPRRAVHQGVALHRAHLPPRARAAAAASASAPRAAAASSP
jgi:CheY-like chemotaxis protein